MSMFNPPNTFKELKRVPIDNLRYQKFGPIGRQVGSNLDFSGSKLDYRIQIEGVTKLLMNRSDFRIRGRIASNNTWSTALLAAEQVAMAMGMPSCLFKEERFKISGQMVDGHDRSIPQRYAYKNRVSRSGNWLNTAGSITFWDAKFQTRLAKVCSDLSYVDYSTGVVSHALVAAKVADLNYHADNTVAIAATVAGTGTRVVTFAEAAAEGGNPDTDDNWVRGDYLSFANIIYRVIEVPANLKTMVVVDDGIGAVVASDNEFKRIRFQDITLPVAFKEPTIGFEVSYKPALSIFDYKYILPIGVYEFEMTPDTNYRSYAVESLGSATKDAGTPTVAGDFYFNITDMYFMGCLADGPDLVDSQIIIDLSDIQVQDELLYTSANFARTYRVKPSTTSISFALQDDRVNTDTRYSHTKFIAGGDERTIRNYQIKYANQTQPRDFPDVKYDEANTAENDNQYMEIYKKNLVYNGQYLGQMGVETFEEFMIRGPYIRLPFLKSDKSEDVQVRIQFTGGGPTNARLFLFSHYNKYAKLTIAENRVIAVEVIEE